MGWPARIYANYRRQVEGPADLPDEKSIKTDLDFTESPILPTRRWTCSRAQKPAFCPAIE